VGGRESSSDSSVRRLEALRAPVSPFYWRRRACKARDRPAVGSRPHAPVD
jgi:hypothetical protein